MCGLFLRKTMSNLGSLIIHLGANTATLASDLGRASHMSAQAAQRMQDDFEKLGKVIGISIGAAATAVTALVKQAINNADDLAKMSAKVGIATESLSAMKHQAGLAGVELAGMQTGLVKFSQNIAAAAGGSKKQADAFAAMGLSVTDLNGRLKPTDQLLRDVSDKFAGYNDGAGKAALAVQLFGKAGAEMIPMLNGGAEAFDDARKEAEAYGVIVSTEAAAASEEFNDNLSRLMISAKGFGNQLSERLIPTLAGLTGAMAEGAKQGQNFESMASGIADAIELVIKVAIVGKGALEGLTNMVAATVDSLIGLAEIGGGALTNIGHALNSVALASQGQFAAAREEMDKAGRAMGDGWESGSSRIKVAWKSAYTGIDDAIKNADSLIAAMGDTMEKTAKRGAQFRNVISGVAGNEKADAPIVPVGGGSGAGKGAADRAERDQQRLIEAQEAFRASTAATIAALDGPMAAALNTYTAGINAAQAALDAGKATPEDFVARQDALARSYSATTVKIAEQAGVLGKLAKDTSYEKSLIGMTARQRVFAEAQRAAEASFLGNAAAMEGGAAAMGAYAQAAGEAAIELYDAALASAEIENIISQFDQANPFDAMVSSIKLIGDELERVSDKTSEAFDESKIAPLQRTLDGLNKSMQQRNLMIAQDGVASLQKYAKEGTAAYTALGIAQDYLAYRSAIASIANQGSGDPYTAFARIAAMIGLMASIGIRVGGGGGGSGPSAQSAEVRQASQGTGTVLGDSAADSESILRASEITANATKELVGINRGMLSALQALQQALGAAGGMLARGAGNVEFARKAGDAGNWNWLSGGDSKLIDQGIIIAGGRLNEMLESIAVGAYQTIKTSGGWFHRDKTSDDVSDISEQFSRQFTLIMRSIADTVREGALAIGLLPAEIDAAMAAYQIEVTRISLKDLSAEEKAAEISAVFSSMFDGLAGHVVPFIEQFQQIGEGLGETLVRVATGVQVTQEAIKQLGFALDESDPEKFAQISEGLIGMMGGIDGMISGMSSFVSNFATDEHKLSVATQALNSAFEQAGMTVPTTADGMWDLMQSLDATTEEGRKQIATLLQLSDVANEYYTLLDKAAVAYEKARMDYAGFIAALNADGAGLSTVSPFIHARMEIEKWERDSIKQANALARAAGLQGAAEQDLVLIHEIAALRVTQAIEALMQASMELVDKLYGSGVQDASDAASSAMSGFGNAITDVADRANAAMNLLLGDLSILNDREKLEVARSGLASGSVSQDQFLQIARRLFGATSRYAEEFRFAEKYPGAVAGGMSGNYASGFDASAASAETRTAEQIARERQADANTLAQNIASLANAQDRTLQEVADSIGLNFGDLATDLGMGNDELMAYIERLQALENMVPAAVTDGSNAIIAAMYDIADMPVPIEPVDASSPGASSGIADEIRSGNESQREEIALLRAELVAMRGYLQSIANTSGVTAENTGEIVTETASTANATAGLLREGGNNSPHRSDRALRLR